MEICAAESEEKRCTRVMNFKYFFHRFLNSSGVWAYLRVLSLDKKVIFSSLLNEKGALVFLLIIEMAESNRILYRVVSGVKKLQAASFNPVNESEEQIFVRVSMSACRKRSLLESRLCINSVVTDFFHSAVVSRGRKWFLLRNLINTSVLLQSIF